MEIDAWKDQPKEKIQEQIAMSRRGVMLLCYGVVALSRYCGEHAMLMVIIIDICADADKKIFMSCDVCHKYIDPLVHQTTSILLSIGDTEMLVTLASHTKE